ncbi:hypothetical protein [Christensenella timonensis]|uniref:hypothetical protein n=1 Tax=Christensenella timonensis TaxID=1816678 RepID=UPI0008363DC0|nr:hypothetical protein [Christensenella timonensis]
MKKDKWTNVVSYGPEDSLCEEDFIRVKDKLRGAWRTLGWVHLRMTNDIDTKSRSPLKKPEIRERISEVMEELQKIMDDDL